MALKEKLIDKAQKLVAKGQLDKAIVEYRAAVDADPRDITIRLRIGDLYVKLGKKTEAIKEYTEAARANAQRGFYLKSIAVYKQILKLEENLEIHNKLAELYVKQRLIADAIGEYSYIVTWFERRGKTAEVLEILKKMVEIDAENVGVRLKLAELYQKLSFDKDALSEYCTIFDKLLSAGKLDTAEKVYLQLYNTNPAEERVLAGLSELYRRKGDNVQRLRFLKGLFNYYSDSAMTDEARRVASDIIQIKPDDPHALRLLKKSETRHVPEGTPALLRVEAPEPVKAEAVEPALISWPEEEIEIEIEGFEEGKEAAAPESSVKIEEAPVQETEKASGGQTIVAAPEVSAPAPAQPGEIEIDIEGLLNGELQVAASPSVESAREPLEAAVAEAAVEEANIEPHEEPVVEEPAAPAVEAVAEEAGIEEAISVISTELQEEERVEAPVEAPVKEAPIDDIIEVHERADVVSESVEAAQEAIEAIEQVQASSADIEQVLDMETGPEPSVAEPAGDDIIESVSVQAEPIEEAISVEALEEASGAQETQDEPVTAEAEAEPLAVEIEARIIEAQAPAVEAESAVVEIEEELQEDLSSAIQELMDKMEPEEAPQAAGEEYVDLSAELGMEEASEDLAGSWGGKESAETFDEFKTGIGKQLSREDSETHYNLGIAYMEMELFSEASKEFKIAMKEARLELDCYLRLGLCAMAESNAEEAIVFYSKGLMAASTDEEKKAMTYELALAYEAAGQDETAFDLFSSIFASDPDFREVASKVSGLALSRPLVPLGDGLIEVELL